MTVSDTAHPEIIRGFSDPTEADIEKAIQGTEREREWYGDVPGFATNADILAGFEQGKLIKIEEGEHYRPATRFLNPDLHGIYPPYLPIAAHALLVVITERWRARADELGVAPDIRLSITSMARSVAYQQELRKNGKLAVDDSTHTKVIGGALDTDLGGYYQGFGADLRAVSVRSLAQQQPIKQVFRTELQARAMSIPLLGAEHFDPRVPQALREVATELHDEGKINRLEEFPGDVNNCLHSAPRPDFLDLAA